MEDFSITHLGFMEYWRVGVLARGQMAFFNTPVFHQSSRPASRRSTDKKRHAVRAAFFGAQFENIWSRFSRSLIIRQDPPPLSTSARHLVTRP